MTIMKLALTTLQIEKTMKAKEKPTSSMAGAEVSRISWVAAVSLTAACVSLPHDYGAECSHKRVKLHSHRG